MTYISELTDGKLTWHAVEDMPEGLYRIRLTRHYSLWYYFTENPQNGGSGSTSASKRVALAQALRTVPHGATYTLTTNGKLEGTFTNKEQTK